MKSANNLEFPGLFPGLLDALHRVGHLAVEHMGVAQRGLEIGVVERLLHQLQVAGLAQQFGADVVPEIMKAKSCTPAARAAAARPPDALVGDGATSPRDIVTIALRGT